MKRQSRKERRFGEVVVLTTRDGELLRALARLRVARTSALTRLCFNGVRRDTAARRLRRLFDAGYLGLRTADATQESLYMLGPKGRQYVRALGEVETPVPRGSLDHHLAIVETWVALATLDLPGVALQLARADWELRAEFPGALPIVPDLFAVLDCPDGAVALAVEVDLGTEPLKVLRAKLENYSRLAAGPEGLFGWKEFGVCVALSGKGRVAFVRELLATDWGGQSFLWCLESGPLEELSRFMDIEPTPLAASPCGKGRGESTSPSPATGTCDQDQGL